jgi:hypothetical protein
MKESFRNTLNILFLFNLLVIYGTYTKRWVVFFTHSVGCLSQKQIGSLNLAGIEGDVKPKIFLKFSSKIGEVWKELKI